jgi:hypothetical protein
MRAPKKAGKKGEASGPKRAASLPSAFANLLDAAGGGQRVGAYELVPKLAYLAFMGGDAMAGSDHQTVLAKLDEAAPTLTVRPVSIVEGQRETNVGVQFKKDAEFTDTFVVERFLEGTELPGSGSDAGDKAIRKWLSPPVRAALLELPDAWVRVEGKAMAITLYGAADADRIGELVTLADVIFAEHGAEGGPSLFGDEDEDEPSDAPAPPPPAAKKASGKKTSAGKSA